MSGIVRKIIKPVLADESEKADTVYMIRQLLLGSFESAFSLAVRRRSMRMQRISTLGFRPDC